MAKYQDGLPLHRQEAILARSGTDLPRQTLARFAVWTARWRDEGLLQPPLLAAAFLWWSPSAESGVACLYSDSRNEVGPKRGGPK